jgi:hypothetical protein
MPNFEHFWPFIASVCSHWFTLLAGCAATVMIGWIVKWKKKSLPLKYDVVILVLFVFFACFQAWQDQYNNAASEHMKTQQAENKLEALTVPKLEADYTIFTAQPTKNDDRNTEVVLNGKIVNHGAPTIIRTWCFRLVFSDGRTVEGESMLPPPREGHLIISPHSSAGSKQVFDGVDYWPLKAGSTPIPTGGAASGWIYYLFRGLPQEQIKKERPKAMFCVTDFNSKTWTFESPLKDTLRYPIDPHDFAAEESKKPK